VLQDRGGSAGFGQLMKRESQGKQIGFHLHHERRGRCEVWASPGGGGG